MSTDIDTRPFECDSESLATNSLAPEYDVHCGPLHSASNPWRAQWVALLKSAVCENPFLHPVLVDAGQTTGLNGRKVSILTLAREGQLEGLITFRPFSLRGLPFPDTATTELNDYHFNGAPLISQVRPAQSVAAWLATFGKGTVPRAWVLRNMHLESPFAGILREAAAQAGFGFQSAHRYQRPMLSRRFNNFDAHAKQVLSRRRLKDLRRNHRRLSEQGDVRLTHATHGADLTQALEDFLRMEASGWKGEAGTALLSTPATAAYARAALKGEASDGLVSIDRLFVDDTPIAASVNLQAGDTRFTPKCAIDEAYRRFSPGLLMEYLIIEAFYAQNNFKQMDSAITTSTHVVASLWNDEAPHGDIVVATTPWHAKAVTAVLNCDAQATPFFKGLQKRAMKMVAK